MDCGIINSVTKLHLVGYYYWVKTVKVSNQVSYTCSKGPQDKHKLDIVHHLLTFNLFVNVNELLTLTPKRLNVAQIFKQFNSHSYITLLSYILMVKYKDFSEFSSRPSSLYWSCTHYYIFHQYQHIFFFSLHATFITKLTSKSHSEIILLYDCSFSFASIQSTIKLWAHACNQVQSMLSDSHTQRCCTTNLFCTELQYTFVTPHKLSQVKPRICSVAHHLVTSFI
jgi:hypothetical protein